MKRRNKDADELATQLRGAIALLKIVDFGSGTDASFKRGWKLSIKGMENALRRQKRLRP